jgi:hypothetical protein
MEGKLSVSQFFSNASKCMVASGLGNGKCGWRRGNSKRGSHGRASCEHPASFPCSSVFSRIHYEIFPAVGVPTCTCEPSMDGPCFQGISLTNILF